jgi:hypothetical protein
MNPLLKEQHGKPNLEAVDYQNAADRLKELDKVPDEVLFKAMEKMPQKVIDELGKRITCG